MKKLYPIISIDIIILVIICLGMFYNQDNVVLKDKHILKEKGTTSISMMYEIEAGSGIYQEATDNSFPSNGYNFNATLSKCENGSALSYDEITGKVMMYANTSDRCYVYFDKQIILIEFSITGRRQPGVDPTIYYQAEENMTWEKWCNSDYNTDGYFVQNDLIGTGTYLLYNVSKDDIISDGGSYSLDLGQGN